MLAQSETLRMTFSLSLNKCSRLERMKNGELRISEKLQKVAQNCFFMTFTKKKIADLPFLGSSVRILYGHIFWGVNVQQLIIKRNHQKLCLSVSTVLILTRIVRAIFCLMCVKRSRILISPFYYCF